MSPQAVLASLALTRWRTSLGFVLRNIPMLTAAALAVAAWPSHAGAQLRVVPGDDRIWVGAAAALGGASLLDADISGAVSRNRRTWLNRLANAVEPLGRQQVVVPAMAGALVTSWAVGGRGPAKAVLRIAAGYAIADALMSTLKPAIGRHRPDTLGGGAWRFRPFSGPVEWHAMPSGHTVHAFSIAAGVADEVHHPVIQIAAYTTAALVGWQRIAFRAHWPSDVVVGSVLAVAVCRTSNRWLRGGLLPSASRRTRLLVVPGAVAVSAPLP